MKLNQVLVFLFVSMSVSCFSQKTPSVLIGNIYRNYGAELHPDLEVVVSYELFAETKSLYISTYHPTGDGYREIIDSISEVIMSDVEDPEQISWTDITGEGYYISGSDVWPYERIESLPYPVYLKIYECQKKDNENYFQDFLNLTVKSVCTPRLDVFNAVESEKVGYLIQGDLVEVIQTQGDWVQIKYLKTDKVYWTYGSCLE